MGRRVSRQVVLRDREVRMSLARYFLLQAGDEWLVTLEGRVMGRYPSRTEAMEAAIVMADLMGAMHYDADVVMQTEPAKSLEFVWTYGVDKLPRAAARRRAEAEGPKRHVHLVQRGEAA
jgi:hypothetical protein